MRRTHTDRDIVRRIGANIRDIRKTRDLPQGGLAQKLGLTFQQVQKYEGGINRVSADTLLAIARALEVDLLRLFDGCDETIPERPFQALEPGDVELIAAARPLTPRARRDVARLVGTIADVMVDLERDKQKAPSLFDRLDTDDQAASAAARLAAQ